MPRNQYDNPVNGYPYNQALPCRTQYDLVPETNSWAVDIVENSPMTAVHLNKPVPVDETFWRVSGSIEDLLFNYTFDSSIYGIYYRRVRPCVITDPNLKKRQYLYAGQLTIFLNDVENWYIPWDATTQVPFAMSTEIVPDKIPIEDPDNPIFNPDMLMDENIFDITFGEKDMLDLLLTYKIGGDVNLDNIDFNQLPSNLSKLIYAYLRVEIYEDYTFFADIQNLTTDTDRVLVQLYEKYVNDHYYRRFKLRPSFPKNEFEPELLNTDSTTSTVVLTDTQIEQKYIEFIPPEIPYGKDAFFVVFNSKIQKSQTDYDYTLELIDSTSVFSALTWSGKGLDGKVQAGDLMYLMWGYVSDFEEII